MLKPKHVDFNFKYKSAYQNLQDDYSYVQLAKHRNKGSDEKILLVLDYMPSEDLQSGRMLSGATGTLLKNILKVSNKYYGEEAKLNDNNWMAISFHGFKTAGQPTAFRDGAKEEFARRLRFIISEYKPTTVITFGPDPYKALNDTLVQRYSNKFQHLYGVPVPTAIKFKDKKHKFNHVPTLSLASLVNDNGKGDEISLAGYVSRNMVTALHGDLKYKIPKLDFKTTLVDTVDKFDKMMKMVKRAKFVAIDTETTGLNRRVNKCLTIQFAVSTKRAFVLPVFHKDSTFTGKEIKYIAKKLQKFFEGDNKNEQHVYANASFDLTVIRNTFDVRYFENNLWDLFAGEYALDENMKFLSGLTGGYYYSLLNLTMQYGCTAYYDAEFGKDQRKTIVSVDLDGPLLEYCSLDVIIPLYLMRLQKQRAADEGYTRYDTIVADQISDMLHTFSTLEYNGCFTDIDYLFSLKTKTSPIRGAMIAVETELKQTKGVKEANKILSKRNGVPSVGLFGKAEVDLFDISKQEHQQLLFFEVMKLKPLNKNKKGLGKVDKHFQKKYAKKAEIALFTQLVKNKKLYSSYVKAFIKQWGVDDDMRFDRRIRPHFEFLDVVTGRTSAKKPSLHQIPSRGELGKHIKRLFITEEGRIMIKVDYSAHEVRCWSLFTGEKGIAKLFDQGRQLRNRFKLAPNSELGQRIKLEGDVHIINAAYFFGVPIEKVKELGLRDPVKGVIFGLIYQQGLKGLAEATGQTMEAIKDLVERFKARFPTGVSWFDDIKEIGKNQLYVESPLGRRRHLWGHLLPADAKEANQCLSRMERLSVNSPIQGMGSDFLLNGSRQIERLRFDHLKETGHYPDFYQANSVHDSIVFSCAYEDFWTAIKIIETGLTDAVAEVSRQRHGMDFMVPLEIDFEIGSNERDVVGWDYSHSQLSTLLKKCLKYQKKELGHKDLDGPAVHDLIMNGQYDQMPDWAKKQAWNAKIKMKGMKKDGDPRAKSERHKVESVKIVKPKKKKKSAGQDARMMRFN